MDPRIKRLYWQLTALLLATHFVGWPAALPLALGLTAIQVLHFASVRRTARALDVQVRIGYLCLLMLGSFEYLWPIHLVQFVGVNAMLVADYCPLARLLVLLPWNRGVPLSAALVRQALCTPPLPGGIHRRLDLQAPHDLG